MSRYWIRAYATKLTEKVFEIDYRISIRVVQKSKKNINKIDNYLTGIYVSHTRHAK